MSSFNLPTPQAPVANPVMIPPAPVRFDTHSAFSPAVSLGLAGAAFNFSAFSFPPTANGPAPSQAVSSPFGPVHTEPFRQWSDQERMLAFGANMSLPTLLGLTAPVHASAENQPVADAAGISTSPELAGSANTTGVSSLLAAPSVPMRASSAPDFIVAGIGRRVREMSSASVSSLASTKDEDPWGSPLTATSSPLQFSPSIAVSAATLDAGTGRSEDRGSRSSLLLQTVWPRGTDDKEDMNEKGFRNAEDDMKLKDALAEAMKSLRASIETTSGSGKRNTLNEDDDDQLRSFNPSEAGSFSSPEINTAGSPLQGLPPPTVHRRKRALSNEQGAAQKRRSLSRPNSENTSPVSTTPSSPATTSLTPPTVASGSAKPGTTGTTTPPIVLRPNQMLKRTGVIARIHHRCPECDKPFARKAHLLSHMVTHLGRRDFACTECPAKFARSHDLLRHRKTVHAAPRRATSASAVAAAPANGEEGKSSRADEAAEEKEKGDRGNVEGTANSAATGFTCEACGVVCKRKDSLMKHMANSCKAKKGGRGNGKDGDPPADADRDRDA
ncbi:hypothetical protein HDU96_008815 [Phlyctochytrium bullatum]|nr:hypothetical protein HDU96_008815 [Phlyctochytrium bullatum]